MVHRRSAVSPVVVDRRRDGAGSGGEVLRDRWD